ncbi:hypothetical protein CALCODRAFT_473534 [Calocera cornea HHB12733]|uniref:Cupredoxin n=1 Tax=Calocera cornea HHB12733 TaxID=1353952 RepID=A0A165E8N0_9BASI|nr:hypothetical protein CALCODRAFT_473534 [Calocera cornea HHB12733]
MFAATAIALSLAALASAQTTHSVMVGANGGLTYTPNTVTAALGDIVQFTFAANNHTATVSSFANPCTALTGSFTSGFQPVAAGSTDLPQVSYNVQTTDPIWFYCGQKVPINHCENGMVFAINPPPNGTNTFANFQANAMALASASSSSSSSSSTSTSSASSTSPSVSIPAAVSEPVVTATFEWQGAPYTTTYSSYPGSPAPTAGVTPTVFNVTVGFNATLTYNPTSVNASIGDIVQFVFTEPGNHTATQTSFNFPCVPETNPDGTRVFDTGYQTVLTVGEAPKIVNFTVETENPQWFGCLQTIPFFHCGAGMVFAVNPPPSGDHSFAAFQALAMSENGTTTSSPSTSPSSAGPSPSSGSGSGAAGLKVGAGLFTLVAGAFALLL